VGTLWLGTALVGGVALCQLQAQTVRTLSDLKDPDAANSGNGQVEEITAEAADPAVTGGGILAPVNFGTVGVGTTGSPMTLSYTFSASDSGISASVVTQGAKGLDFADAGTGTCDTNGTSYAYSAGSTCTVNVTFAPKYAGGRYGAMVLSDATGVIATGYLRGTGQGPELVFPSNQAIQPLGGGFGNPWGVAVDASGNIYVADFTNSTATEMPAGCISSSCVTRLGGGFANPSGAAVDGAGNLYVGDYGNNAVKEVPRRCVSAGCVITLGGGFSYPRGVAVDGSGNIYVADDENNAVKEMPPGCTSPSCVTALGGGFSYPFDVAVDESGNVYIADVGNNAVKEMPAGCSSASCVTTLGGGFDYPDGVTVDGAGNIYVADTDNSEIKEMPPGCASSSCVTTLGGGFDGPSDVAVDGAGNVYIADTNNNAVKELNLASPPNLSFANTSVGVQSSDSPKAATLKNMGNAALTFPVPGTGENPSVSANFTLDASTSCPEVLTSSSAGTLAAGVSCELAVDFIPTTIGAITGAVVLTDNNLNASPAATQSIGLSGSGTLIVPYIQVNSGAWQNVTSVTVAYGSIVNLGPQPGTGGSWSWSGPGLFTSTAREIDGIPLNSATNVFTATYTDTAGVATMETFTITVGPATITPYLEANGGAWQGTNNATVAAGSTVNLGPQASGSGTWSWSGPGFTSSAQQVNNVPLTSASNVYTATFTNGAGVSSTEAFTITVALTGITPYVEVNGGAWQGMSSVTVAAGSTVNLGPQAAGSGTWSWSGPGFTSSAQQVNNVPLTSASNIYTATFTNAAGVRSTETFTITVAPTSITPYIEVNGGAWQGTNGVTVAAGSTVNLGPQSGSGGSWRWSGPNGYESSSQQINGIPLTLPSNVYTATYTNVDGVTSTQAFTITIAPTMIVPYIQDYEQDGGAWQNISSITANYTDTVNIGPQPGTGGSWSWTGPNGFTSTSRALNAISLTLPTNIFTATYTNPAGVTSSEVVTITVAPTPIVPYIEDLQQDGGAWQNVSSITANYSDTVNLAPQPGTGGSWSWTGPNGFTSTSRALNAIALSPGTNSYVATYTNPAGVKSTQTFILLASTPIVPYLQDYEQDGGAWQNVSSITANYTDTVNLGPQSGSGGSWRWSGPNGYESSSQQINGIPLTLPSNVYTASYTNSTGVTSTLAFTITVEPTPIVPYLEVNGGAWQATNSVTVAAGSTVTLGPQPANGTWKWSGPNGFTSSSRQINDIPLSVGTNSYVASYTNPAGVTVTETFTITLE